MNTRRDGSGKIGVYIAADSDIEEAKLFEEARKYLELQKQYRNYVRMGLVAYIAAVIAVALTALVLSISFGITTLISILALTLVVIVIEVYTERRWRKIYHEKREWWLGIKDGIGQRFAAASKRLNAHRTNEKITSAMSEDTIAYNAAKEVYDRTRSLRL